MDDSNLTPDEPMPVEEPLAAEEPVAAEAAADVVDLGLAKEPEAFEPPPAPAVPYVEPPAPPAPPAPPQPSYAAQPPAPPQPSYAPPSAPPAGAMSTEKNKVVAGVLAILLGSLGIHKFYLGYTKEGIILIAVTFVSFGMLAWASSIVGLIEGIMYLTKSDEEFYATYVAGRKSWF